MSSRCERRTETQKISVEEIGYVFTQTLNTEVVLETLDSCFYHCAVSSCLRISASLHPEGKFTDMQILFKCFCQECEKEELQ